MEREILVSAEVGGRTEPVGRLWTRYRRGVESASFEYDRRWLRHPAAFSLEPALTLDPGPQHTGAGRAIFGALADSAPDRWGRLLMRRAERRRAEEEQRAPRALAEIDFLLMVDDEARTGALRFQEKDGDAYLSAPVEGSRIPPFLEMVRLLAATDRLEREKETGEDIRLLLAPGSSLGGARPKATVRDKDGSLAIAKFPRKTDEVRTVLWEAVALELARKAGIPVAPSRIVAVGKQAVLVVRRFDRARVNTGLRRVPFLSAMSMLGAVDNETRSYMEIADSLRRHGAEPRQDMRQLWRRIVFNIMTSNTDDHLRNHAFVYEGNRGWRLSPAYDLNPTPTDLKPRFLSTAIDLADTTASMEVAFRVAAYFDADPEEARVIVGEVARAVARWRVVAARFGLLKKEIDRMQSAFEIAEGYKAGVRVRARVA